MKKLHFLLIFAIILMLFAGSTFAENNSDAVFYLRINGMEGESADPDHLKWIDLMSFARGSSISDTIVYKFRHKVDKTTQMIQEACMKDRVIDQCVIEACHVTGGITHVDLRITLKDVRITRAEISRDDLGDGNSQAVESVTITANEEKVEMSPEPSIPETGDNARPLLWALLSAAACAAILRSRKREVPKKH